MVDFLPEVPTPTEGVRHVQMSTTLYAKNATTLVATGTLYITESVVCWISDSGKGITLPYENIIIHAVHRNPSNTFPHECLYIHTDAKLPWPSDSDDDSDDIDEDIVADDNPKVTELYFVPEDKDSLKDLYQVMSECQALHPDMDEFSPDEDFFEDDGGDVDETDEQLAGLRLNPDGTYAQNGDVGPEDVDMDPDCFEDAEEDLREQ